MTSQVTNPAMMSQPLPSFSFSNTPSPSFSPSASGVKRRAPSPPPTNGTTAAPWPGFNLAEGSSPLKKRRPNLANGFSGLSISGSFTPVNDTDQMESHETGDLEDDEISSHRGAHHKDIGVEVLPDNPSQASKRSSATNRLWSHGSSSSSPSDDASDKDYDSDATFRLPSNQKAFGRVQQPDSVHLPEHDTASSEHHLLDIEDLTESLSNRKRRHRDAESVSQRTRKKKRPEGMDVEMDMGESSRRDSDSDDGIEEITRAPGRRRSRNTHWHEPEKDRIVITSLSSSPSSSRSSSPENTSQHRNLTQPGEQGFTLSPSLLTHLLGKQSWDKMPPLSGHSPDQKGLVLYRPLGIPPGTDMQWDEIVRRWKEGGSGSGTQQDDSSRFEMIDDDENLQSFQAKSMADQGMDESGPVVNEYGVGDVPMDIE